MVLKIALYLKGKEHKNHTKSLTYSVMLGEMSMLCSTYTEKSNKKKIVKHDEKKKIVYKCTSRKDLKKKIFIFFTFTM